jgi:hypothetical protein
MRKTGSPSPTLYTANPFNIAAGSTAGKIIGAAAIRIMILRWVFIIFLSFSGVYQLDTEWKKKLWGLLYFFAPEAYPTMFVLPVGKFNNLKYTA